MEIGVNLAVHIDKQVQHTARLVSVLHSYLLIPRAVLKECCPNFQVAISSIGVVGVCRDRANPGKSDLPQNMGEGIVN